MTPQTKGGPRQRAALRIADHLAAIGTENSTANLKLQAAHVSRRFRLPPATAGVVAFLVWEARQ
jgi:hypothetical protein